MPNTVAPFDVVRRNVSSQDLQLGSKLQNKSMQTHETAVRTDTVDEIVSGRVAFHPRLCAWLRGIA
jgi:hypothetical protein